MSKFQETRRDFIKTASLVAGAAIAGQFIAGEANAQGGIAAYGDVLRDTVDLHIHCSPDDTTRKDNGLVFAQMAKAAGQKAILLKTHLGSTYDQAFFTRLTVDFPVYAAITLNLTTTGTDVLNPFAVEKEIEKGDYFGHLLKYVWLPTHSSMVQAPTRGYVPIRVVDDNLNPLPETLKVMELCAEHDLCLGTGHSDPLHGLALAKKAKEIGVNKFIITHATTSAYFYTLEQVQEALSYGAYVELVYISVGRTFSMAQQAEYLRLDPNKVFIATDLGQVNNPYPTDGLKMYIEALKEEGITDEQIDMAIRTIPAKLIDV